jgi:FixJ family two-component response regulator
VRIYSEPQLGTAITVLLPVTDVSAPVDALVTDVVMPGIQGKEVAKRVRELQPDIGILYMSGYTEGLLSAQGILEPGITLIEKPFTEASMLKTTRDTARARDSEGQQGTARDSKVAN